MNPRNIRSQFLSLSTAVILLALATTPSMADSVQAKALVIRDATVHSLEGPPTRTSLVIEDGIITTIADQLGDGMEGRDYEEIMATDLHVYPGLVDAYSTLGLVEIGAVSATVDTAEMGRFNPHLQAATAVHPASDVIPVTRANGITHALVAPAPGQDGIIAGQAVLMHLDGWTIEEMAIEPAAAMVIQWPAIQTRSFDFSTFSIRETPFAEAKKKAEKAQQELRDWLDAARHYQQAEKAGSKRLERDLRLESLAQVLDDGMPVIFRADNQRDIEGAIEFADEQGLDMILAGGRDAWKVKELLVEHDIPVILRAPQSLPSNANDPYDRPFRNAGELSAAGIRFAFASGAGSGFGPGGPHGSRTVPYEAATAAAYGLPAEEALKAITLYPAQILGIDDRFGSIVEGKVANLIVTDGDPLEITTQIKHLIINGREVSTDNRHRSLYERYRARPMPATE